MILGSQRRDIPGLINTSGVYGNHVMRLKFHCSGASFDDLFPRPFKIVPCFPLLFQPTFFRTELFSDLMPFPSRRISVFVIQIEIFNPQFLLFLQSMLGKGLQFIQIQIHGFPIIDAAKKPGDEGYKNAQQQAFSV
jgi:hypothetical protein